MMMALVMNGKIRAGVAGVIAAATLLAMPLAGAWADDSKVQLQGRGPKRDALSAMQYKAFDGALLDGLKGWSGGEALTGAGIKGKPVLIVAWASWLRGSHSGLTIAQQEAEKFGAMGLEVVCVHHTRGFEGAKAAAEGAKFNGRMAHDEKGELFKALKVEGGGPDFYVIDRAGNLRFAQVDRKSVDEAMEIVVKETPEDATKAKAPEATSEGAGGDGGKGKAKGGDGGAWKQPPASAYSAAKWPEKNPNVDVAKDVQGKALPVKMGNETWVTEKPEMAGKVIVLDFWATWCGPCIAASPMLDKLQGRFKDELVVVGMSGQKRPGKPEDVSAIKTFLNRKPAKYSHANDLSQGIYKSLDIKAIPHVVVLSTDGTVRWQGNPHDQGFEDVVEGVIKNDPGVKKK